MFINKGVNAQKPLTNNGIVNPQKSATFIDYITLSIDGIEDCPTYFKWFNYHLKKFSLTISQRLAKVPPSYDLAYQLCLINNQNLVCGSIKFSHLYQRLLLEFSGNGCAMLAKQDNYSWLNIYVNQPVVSIKRLDIAYDDFNGSFPIQLVDKVYCRGGFNSCSGRRPLKDNVGERQKSRTRYIGGKSGYKLACIYEKGKNLGSVSHPNWVRHEIRFRSNSRDLIPKEVLANLDSYFFNAFPKAYKRLVNKVEYHSVVYRKNLEYACDLKTSLVHLRHQYGRKVKETADILGAQSTVQLLSREGRSKSYKRLPFVSDEFLKAKFVTELQAVEIFKSSK
ncbi:replication initiation factor domain-containing protein [Paraglaciecola sp.]|uniref:replication initiation factor domain-containing protein n=1 Tax=Paraglaciecola sp. TaxID=1920173 RepID=UPI0030F3D397